MPKLHIKHLFLTCSIAAFTKFFFTSSYLDVILVAAFCVCYFMEEFKAYQITADQAKKDILEIRTTVNNVLSNNKVLHDRINEVRSASSISKAFNAPTRTSVNGF